MATLWLIGSRRKLKLWAVWPNLGPVQPSLGCSLTPGKRREVAGKETAILSQDGVMWSALITFPFGCRNSA